MNSKKFSEVMSELGGKYVDEALYYKKDSSKKKYLCRKKIAVFIAAVIALLSLCGVTAYESGLYDLWLEKPNIDPIKTVQSAITGQVDKEYTITVSIDEIVIDEDETARIRAMYSGSEYAKEAGWTDDYIAEHLIAVAAKYYVEYDHTKTFLDDGDIHQYFYLIQDVKSGNWKIFDNSSPGCF